MHDYAGWVSKESSVFFFEIDNDIEEISRRRRKREETKEKNKKAYNNKKQLL